MADYLPPDVALAGILIIAAYMLLEEEQRRGRLLIARAKRLAAFIVRHLGVDHA